MKANYLTPKKNNSYIPMPQKVQRWQNIFIVHLYSILLGEKYKEFM
jgi:hypothetical protein